MKKAVFCCLRTIFYPSPICPRAVYEKLYTPYGLRSLAQGEAGYRGEYKGRLIGRDLAYHMGTVWGYLAGAFFDAWAKTMCRTEKDREQLACMIGEFKNHMADGCLGGIAEIFDGEMYINNTIPRRNRH